jgi:hypothetical protein
MEWETRLMSGYCEVCEQYQRQLWQDCERMSNNHEPDFTDEEVITIYLFGIMRHYRTVKAIYEYTRDHLGDWFRRLPSYEAYVQRLNNVGSVFPACVNAVAERWPSVRNGMVYLLDSMPIMLAAEKRRKRAKVASEVANCGYCGSKDVYDDGVKVHLLAIRQAGHLPRPEYLEVTPASNHDLTVLDGLAPHVWQVAIYADKADIDEMIRQILEAHQSAIHTPVKRAKGQERLQWFEQLLSTAVSRVRQPIESFFNWVEEQTGIQRASKVRSLKG